MEIDDTQKNMLIEASLTLAKAKSLLLMMTCYHEDSSGNLHAHDVDNVVTVAFDLVSSAHGELTKIV